MVGRFAWIVLGLGLDSTRAFSASILHHQGKATTPRSTILATTTVAVNDSLDNKRNNQTEEAGPTSSSSSTSNNNNDAGSYRKFAEHAWERLTALEYLQDAKVEPQFQNNRSAVHPKDGSSVLYMTVRALTGSPAATSPIRYARYALLETQLPSTAAASTSTNTAGSSTTIQVLNLVVFPNSDLPVWGADFVSLPGNKHLLLLDAQPMPIVGGDVGDGGVCDYSQHWEEWYQSHDIAATFPWGGDLPEQVQPFVSKFALWSRLGGGGGASGTANTPDTVRAMMEGPLYEAYCDHLDRYLDLVASSSSSSNNDQSTSTTRIGDYHGQRDYIAYRLANDPARPMLKRLFGEEWTEQVLENVLFPQF